MKILATTAVFAALAAPAFAGSASVAVQEPVVIAPAPVYVASQDWTGGYVGANLGYGKLDTPANGEAEGVLGGVHAGYLYDMGNYVVGGEIDYNAADMDVSTGTGKIEDLARLKLKAGYDLGRTLVYGQVGGALAQGTFNGVEQDGSGYLVGLGTAYKVSDSVSVGGEVNYQEFKDFGNSTNDLSGTTATARVSFHF
ncbi:hypothetical protein BV394_01140 [Brevirhabdus pacifica]|uniref:Outer membrane protein beta-barrel domain-containing protein n=2 Tax=Brevirhabdus pacifica TaxID=1267768 RepID=A0A1U7DEW7_9RHOB|nr:outer membrane beta-barrel protein [Brevirhabdus pacifica]APX88501.1 hypothetical protein BV394_01140 [Brevirhabdus pacifica]OWU79803.1 hypothetical protein ATO5_01840 [Loktanella sp. 22II-4b]PJJ87019.1 opacity protein-like surface antigen [Brevirhabdus pacifica]